MQKARLFLQSRAERDLLLPPRLTRFKPSCVSSRACLLLVCPAGGLTLPRVQKAAETIRQHPLSLRAHTGSVNPCMEPVGPHCRVSRMRRSTESGAQLAAGAAFEARGEKMNAQPC